MASEGFRKPRSWLPLIVASLGMTIHHRLQVLYLTPDIPANYTTVSVRTTRTEKLGTAVLGSETYAELSRRGNKGEWRINGMSLDTWKVNSHHRYCGGRRLPGFLCTAGPLHRSRTFLEVSEPTISKREARATCKCSFTLWLLEFKQILHRHLSFLDASLYNIGLTPVTPQYHMA